MGNWRERIRNITDQASQDKHAKEDQGRKEEADNLSKFHILFDSIKPQLHEMISGINTDVWEKLGKIGEKSNSVTLSYDYDFPAISIETIQEKKKGWKDFGYTGQGGGVSTDLRYGTYFESREILKDWKIYKRTTSVCVGVDCKFSSSKGMKIPYLMVKDDEAALEKPPWTSSPKMKWINKVIDYHAPYVMLPKGEVRLSADDIEIDTQTALAFYDTFLLMSCMNRVQANKLPSFFLTAGQAKIAELPTSKRVL